MKCQVIVIDNVTTTMEAINNLETTCTCSSVYSLQKIIITLSKVAGLSSEQEESGLLLSVLPPVHLNAGELGAAMPWTHASC